MAEIVQIQRVQLDLAQPVEPMEMAKLSNAIDMLAKSIGLRGAAFSQVSSEKGRQRVEISLCSKPGTTFPVR